MGKDKYTDLASHEGVRVRVERVEGIQPPGWDHVGDEPPPSEPPVNVLTRAVALAVETYLRSKMERALDGLFIKRGKL